MSEILKRAQKGYTLSQGEILELLQVAVGSGEYYALLHAANAYAHQAFGDKGLLFAQIGLDAQPCRINCKFCSLAKDSFCGSPVKKSMEETVSCATALCKTGISDLFLMTTAEFSHQDFLSYGEAVRAAIPQNMRLVANVADFDFDYATALRRAGFAGVYHVHRLREGIDTGAAPSARLRTLDAIRDAGLELYYCIEPIGPEHTYQEIADEILRIRDYPVEVMAVMKRTAVPGTPLAPQGEISAAELAKICAVTTLSICPPRAMCVHEPDELCLMAGANQLYAECGVNPRDTQSETEHGRGFSTRDAGRMLWNAGWKSEACGQRGEAL